MNKKRKVHKSISLCWRGYELYSDQVLGSVHYFVRFLQLEQHSDLFWLTHPPSHLNTEDR